MAIRLMAAPIAPAGNSPLSQQSNISRQKSVVSSLAGQRGRPDADHPIPERREIRVMGVVLEMACLALRTGDCADDVKQAIANKIIALAKAGERSPDALCEQVLKDIRTEPA
jgi:hypothetical protein